MGTQNKGVSSVNIVADVSVLRDLFQRRFPSLGLPQMSDALWCSPHENIYADHDTAVRLTSSTVPHTFGNSPDAYTCEDCCSSPPPTASTTGAAVLRALSNDSEEWFRSDAEYLDWVETYYLDTFSAASVSPPSATESVGRGGSFKGTAWGLILTALCHLVAFMMVRALDYYGF